MSLFFFFLVLSPMWPLTGLPGVQAQETDITQTPNNEQAGIKKSLDQQIGAGQGDINTPNSSLYIISRDPFRSIRRDRNFFSENLLLSRVLVRRGGTAMGILRLRDRSAPGLSIVAQVATDGHVDRRDLVETYLPVWLAGMPRSCSG